MKPCGMGFFLRLPLMVSTYHESGYGRIDSTIETAIHLQPIEDWRLLAFLSLKGYLYCNYAADGLISSEHPSFQFLEKISTVLS